MKVVFFGTSEVGIPCLEALIKDHEILQVITSPDALVGRNQVMTSSAISQFATENNLPVSKPESVKNNPEFISYLNSLQADIYIVVAYGKILPLELITIPPLKTINVHFSLLPKYRGAAPIQFALLNGEQKTGTSIFILDELVDHGPLLGQDKIAIEPEDTFLTLAPKLSALSAELLIKILPDYGSGKLAPQPQNHEAATNTNLIRKEDGRVEWNKLSSEIYNQYRAFKVWPGLWTTWNNQPIKILECQPASSIEEVPPGTIHDNLVSCGGGSQLELISVQLAGSNPMPIKEFLRGHAEFTRGLLK